MLVLSRSEGEVITIGDNIRIEVVRILGRKVRIGIEADPSIPIHRLEVWEKLQRQKQQEEEEK